MRFHAALTPVLGSPSKLRLLRTLFYDPGRRWTGRELARAARVSTAQAARDLVELDDTSLVIREVVGRSYSWRLNSAHVLSPILADLFRREAGFRLDLIREVSEGLALARVEKARLFGSIARGEERDDSDIDLFLQIRDARDRERAEEAVDRIRTRVWSRFGNPLSALIYTRAEVARPRNPGLIRAVESEGLNALGGE